MSPRVPVSVLLNVWKGDKPSSLRASLQSVASQSVRPDQLVVVVDGPVPTSLDEVLSSGLRLFDGCVTIERLDKNRGLWNARNVGIDICRNEIIAVHDADDLMHRDRLLVQFGLFRSLCLDVLGCVCVEYSPESNKLVGLRAMCVGSFMSPAHLRWRNPIQHSSVMFSKTSVSRVGLYRNRPGVEDLDLWRRLVRSGARVTNSKNVLQALGTNSSLLKRRRISVKVFCSEILLAWDELRSDQGFGRLLALPAFFVRCAYRLLPIRIMGVAQKSILRDQLPLRLTCIEDFLNTRPE